MTVVASNVPPEVWLVVCEILDWEHYEDAKHAEIVKEDWTPLLPWTPPWHQPIPGRSDSLCALSSTCRDLRQIAFPLLFKTTAINFTPEWQNEVLEPFSKAIVSPDHEHVRSQVRELRVEQSLGQWSGPMHSFGPYVVETLFPLIPHLTRLSLHTLFLPHFLLDSLLQLPIQDLHLNECHTEDGPPSPWKNPVGTLRSVDIRNCTNLVITAWGWVRTLLTPSLTHLGIDFVPGLPGEWPSLPNLEYLGLYPSQTCMLSVENHNELQQILASSPTLQSLYISKRLTAPVEASLPNLRSIRCSVHNTTMFISGRPIEEIDVFHGIFVPEHWNAFTTGIREKKGDLRTLKMRGVLLSTDFWRPVITADHFADFLPEHLLLRHLELPMTDETDIESLSSTIGTLHQLRFLSFDQRREFTEEDIAWQKQIVQRLSHLPHLTQINFAHGFPIPWRKLGPREWRWSNPYVDRPTVTLHLNS